MIAINYIERNKELFAETKGSLAYSSFVSPYDPNLTLFSDEQGRVVGVKMIVNDDWELTLRHWTHNPTSFKVPVALKQEVSKFLESKSKQIA
jgi:hypothetical protein